MLVLQRRAGESLRIGDDIEISVISLDGNRVRLAITAPAQVPILRSELVKARDANKDSAMEQSAPTELLHMLEGVLPAEHGKHPVVPVKPVSHMGIQKKGE